MLHKGAVPTTQTLWIQFNVRNLTDGNRRVSRSLKEILKCPRRVAEWMGAGLPKRPLEGRQTLSKFGKEKDLRERVRRDMFCNGSRYEVGNGEGKMWRNYGTKGGKEVMEKPNKSVAQRE